jgi:phosphatidylglycerophosphate synthase
MPSLAATATTESKQLAPRMPRRSLPGLALAIAALVAATTALASLAARLISIDPAWPTRTAVVAGAGGALVLVLAALRLDARTFGAANAVTLVRGALTAALLALLGARLGGAVAWVAIVTALLALLLDGVDGALARRRREESAFGARFDMETDALLIVALAAVVWQLGKAGPWILLAGALRYLFMAASLLWAALRAPLPPSRRRQTVCVVQIAALIVCLVPLVPPPASAALGLASLTALTASFGVDLGWLVRRSRRSSP